MTEQHALFDNIGEIRVDLPFHHCTGCGCTYCERQDRKDFKLLAEIDPKWRMTATAWLKTIDIGGSTVPRLVGSRTHQITRELCHQQPREQQRPKP